MVQIAPTIIPPLDSTSYAAFAAHMGQVGLGSAERYLSMTPERFRKRLLKLSSQRRKKRSRDNPALIKFLAEL